MRQYIFLKVFMRNLHIIQKIVCSKELEKYSVILQNPVLE